jgi:hypothetical protein
MSVFVVMHRDGFGDVVVDGVFDSYVGAVAHTDSWPCENFDLHERKVNEAPTHDAYCGECESLDHAEQLKREWENSERELERTRAVRSAARSRILQFSIDDHTNDKLRAVANAIGNSTVHDRRLREIIEYEFPDLATDDAPYSATLRELVKHT